jgi:thioredoxin
MKQIKSKKEFEELVVEEQSNALVKFSAGWCGPCKVLGQTIEEVENDYPNVKFIEVDVDSADEDFLNDFSIRSVPKVVLYKKGEKIEEFLGAVGKQQLLDKLGKII